MASVPAAPIRQPRGPSISGFNRPPSPSEPTSTSGTGSFGGPASGPPAAEPGSTLRRNRTVGSGQSGRYGHSTSASLGGAAFGYPGASSGPGGRVGGSGATGTGAGPDGGPKYKESRFRSGSLSSQHSATSASAQAQGQAHEGQSGVARRTSTRDRPESRSGVQEVVHEDQDLESPVGGLEGGWGKGLARQSSLPSRRRESSTSSLLLPTITSTSAIGISRLINSAQRVHLCNPTSPQDRRSAPSPSAHL